MGLEQASGHLPELAKWLFKQGQTYTNAGLAQNGAQPLDEQAP
jgi:hypothetical protein